MTRVNTSANTYIYDISTNQKTSFQQDFMNVNVQQRKGWNNFKTLKFLILSVAYLPISTLPPYLPKFWWTAQASENESKVWGMFCAQCISDCHFCMHIHTQKQTYSSQKSFFSTAVLLFSISTWKYLLLQLKIFCFDKKKSLDFLRFLMILLAFLSCKKIHGNRWDVT